MWGRAGVSVPCRPCMCHVCAYEVSLIFVASVTPIYELLWYAGYKGLCTKAVYKCKKSADLSLCFMKLYAFPSLSAACNVCL